MIKYLTVQKPLSAHEIQEPSSANYNATNIQTLQSRLNSLTKTVRSELTKQGFEPSRIRIERMLNMRFDGTDTALMVLPSAELGEKSGEGEDGESQEDFEKAFKRMYKSEFGFLLDSKNIVVDDLKVRGIGKTFDSLGQSVFEELKELKTRVVGGQGSEEEKVAMRYSVYFEGVGRVHDTRVYELDRLEVGDEVRGPAMIIDNTQTIVVIPGARAIVARKHLVVKLEDKDEE